MHKSINILIVEDEILIAEDLKEILQEVGYTTIFKAKNYNQALTFFETENIGLVLLDIKLSDQLSGIDLANYINKHLAIPFIYITSYSDQHTIIQVKHTSPAAFLLKPYNKTQLLASVEIALFNFSKKIDPLEQLKAEVLKPNLVVKNNLLIKTDYSFTKIPLAEILWFESDKNYVEVKTTNKNYLIRCSLKKLQQQLPEDVFVKCYKQFIINLKKVESFSVNSLTIEDKKIPISRNKQKYVLDKLTKWMH